MHSRRHSEPGRQIDREAALDYIREGYLLAPRTVLKGHVKRPQIFPVLDPAKVTDLPLQAEQMLEASMGKLSGVRRAVMFSGGFDSLLICLLAKRGGARVTAVTIGFEDFNSRTVRTAAESAQAIGVDHCVLSVKTAEFLSAFEALAGITDEPVFDLDLAVVYAGLKKYDRRMAGKIFISGMGSDQWFGTESLQTGGNGLQAQLQKTVSAEVSHQKVAQAHGCSFIFPFISRPLLALSQAVPVKLKKNKQLLRALSVVQGIRPLHASREMQVSPVIRRLLIQVYGRRAWPDPVTINPSKGGMDQKLRQIVLGLWLEKTRKSELKTGKE